MQAEADETHYRTPDSHARTSGASIITQGTRVLHAEASYLPLTTHLGNSAPSAESINMVGMLQSLLEHFTQHPPDLSDELTPLRIRIGVDCTSALAGLLPNGIPTLLRDILNQNMGLNFSTCQALARKLPVEPMQITIHSEHNLDRSDPLRLHSYQTQNALYDKISKEFAVTPWTATEIMQAERRHLKSSLLKHDERAVITWKGACLPGELTEYALKAVNAKQAQSLSQTKHKSARVPQLYISGKIHGLATELAHKFMNTAQTSMAVQESLGEMAGSQNDLGLIMAKNSAPTSFPLPSISKKGLQITVELVHV